MLIAATVLGAWIGEALLGSPEIGGDQADDPARLKRQCGRLMAMFGRLARAGRLDPKKSADLAAFVRRLAPTEREHLIGLAVTEADGQVAASVGLDGLLSPPGLAAAPRSWNAGQSEGFFGTLADGRQAFWLRRRLGRGPKASARREHFEHFEENEDRRQRRRWSEGHGEGRELFLWAGFTA